MVQTFFEVCFVSFFILLIWLIVGMSFHSVIRGVKFFERIKIRIRRKDENKYRNKVNPIYRIRESSWGTEMYIDKWSLKYNNKEWVDILLFFIPYPIEVLFWGYSIDDSVYICDKKNISNITGTLEHNYEKLWNEKNDELNMKLKIRESQEQKIQELNETFLNNHE